MPKHLPALATRVAVTATAAAAAALVSVLPATPAAAPATAAPAAPASAPATVSLPVAPVAMATPAVAASTAVNHAMSKVGAPYRWGAAGPYAFDCSGLVTWAFKNAGVALPRTSQAMARVGRPVAKANLRPGDLVFFYPGASHVGIYIGNGKVVNALNDETPVNVVNVNYMPFNSARRI
ncbi:MAG: peptidoglycan DL-endopeptidase CwlO [Pseudonocardiales bacterium]|nr:putative secreted protein [Pseudonocardia sp.]MDT7652721.1 peptidoglycan DL-endopeptidase CwlO [Pseudonocardiales bacterium]